MPSSEASLSPMLAASTSDAVLDEVKNSGSSFLIGMMALPRARRMGMFGLYAFCRAVDDIADSDWPAEKRLTVLESWRDHVGDLFKGEATHPVMQLLAPAVLDFDIREQDFHDIIEGMVMDARETIIAPSWDALDTYCDHVASAVGRVSVRIFGESSEASREVAHHLGRALQLTNILRDLDEDAARGRLYLPREALEEAGILSGEGAIDIAAVLAHPALDAACRAVARRAATHFDAADEALGKCDPKAMKPARIMRDYYEGLLHRLLQQGWAAPRARVSLGIFEKLKLLLKALF